MQEKSKIGGKEQKRSEFFCKVFKIGKGGKKQKIRIIK